MSTFIVDADVRADLERFTREARSTGLPLSLDCFSEAEARWFQDELEARGVVVARISWLVHDRAAI